VEGQPSGSYKLLEEYRLSGEEIRELLFGRTITGIVPKTEIQWWIKVSKDGKRTEQWNNKEFSDSGKGWLEGDLFCRQMKIFLKGTKIYSYIYHNPDGTPDKKNEYLFVEKDRISPFSPTN
jgi:hypothetical protein